MKSRLAALLALVAAALTTALATPARATEGNGEVTCPGVAGWFVNPDEQDRKPETGADGFTFGPADLIHHSTETKLADLEPGAFNLATGSETPDQTSFFSVEVRDPSGAYGTLRWDVPASKWTIVIGAGTGPDGAATDGAFSDADPVKLLEGKVSKWGAFSANTMVTTFGVGYTKNPPGTKTVTVKSVTFGGQIHSLACTPPTTQPTTIPPTTAPTTSPVTTPPTTAPTTSAPKDCAAYVYTGSRTTLCDRFPDGTKDNVDCRTVGYQVTLKDKAVDPWGLDGARTIDDGHGCESYPVRKFPSATPSSTSPAPTFSPAPIGQVGGDDGGLPVTGAAAGIMGGIALIVIGTGGLLVVASRRRKMRFEG